MLCPELAELLLKPQFKNCQFVLRVNNNFVEVIGLKFTSVDHDGVTVEIGSEAGRLPNFQIDESSQQSVVDFNIQSKENPTLTKNYQEMPVVTLLNKDYPKEQKMGEKMGEENPVFQDNELTKIQKDREEKEKIKTQELKEKQNEEDAKKAKASKIDEDKHVKSDQASKSK